MAKEVAILFAQLPFVSEQTISLGLEHLEIIEGDCTGRAQRGPRSLPLIQERIRCAGIRAAVVRTGAKTLDARRSGLDRGGIVTGEEKECDDTNNENEEVPPHHTT